MIRHLLVPTDGSPDAEAAAREAAALAHAVGGRLTALCVKPRFHAFTLRPAAVEDTKGDAWDEDLQARNALAAVERIATEAGVPCAGLTVEGDHPWKAILDVAAKQVCDAVVMAPHGRSGLRGLLLGSETQRVLAHATLPVLVVRRPSP